MLLSALKVALFGGLQNEVAAFQFTSIFLQISWSYFSNPCHTHSIAHIYEYFHANIFTYYISLSWWAQDIQWLWMEFLCLLRHIYIYIYIISDWWNNLKILLNSSWEIGGQTASKCYNSRNENCLSSFMCFGQVFWGK